MAAASPWELPFSKWGRELPQRTQTPLQEEYSTPDSLWSAPTAPSVSAVVEAWPSRCIDTRTSHTCMPVVSAGGGMLAAAEVGMMRQRENLSFPLCGLCLPVWLLNYLPAAGDQRTARHSVDCRGGWLFRWMQARSASKSRPEGGPQQSTLARPAST